MGANPLARRMAAPLLALGLALGAGACSDGGAPGASPAAPAPSGAASPAPPQTTTPPPSASSVDTMPPAATSGPDPTNPAATTIVPPLPWGTAVDDAIRAVRAAGLVVEVGPAPGFSSLSGVQVGRSRPRSGRVVPTGSSVKLVLGNGPMASPTCMNGKAPAPDVTGLDLETALGVLGRAQLGWDVQPGLPALAPGGPSGTYLGAFTVTAQQPTRGTPIEQCSLPSIHLAVAPTDPDTVRLPQLVGTGVDDALRRLSDAGLVGATSAGLRLSNLVSPAVDATDPSTPSVIPRGSTVTLHLGIGALGSPACPVPDRPVTVPDVVGLPLTDAITALDRTRLPWSTAGPLPALPPDPARTSYYDAFAVTAQHPAAGTTSTVCGDPPVALTVAANGPA